MSHYTILQDQLKFDAAAAWSTTSVNFGGPPKPDASYPLAVANVSLERQNVGRQVQQNWSVVIEGRFAIDDCPADTDFETYLMAKGEDLAMLLAPYSEVSVEALGAVEFYAGIGTKRYVAAIVPLDPQDDDLYLAVQIAFSCMTTVWQ